MAESQAMSVLDERLYDDPSQLSQLLQQRTTAGSNRVVHFTTSTEESEQSVFVASAPAVAIAIPDDAVAEQHLQLPVVPAPPHHAAALAPSSRRVATSRHVQPALLTHHSAPTITEFVKETTDGALKMHHSFAGIDAPGDTQPDSQIYKPWTSNAYGTSDLASFAVPKLQPPKSLFSEHEDDEDEDEADSPTDGTEYVESSQPQQQSPTVTSPTVMHDDDMLGESLPGNYAPTSPLKFETPGMAGRRRDSSNQMLSSAAHTNITPGTVMSTIAFPGLGGGAAPAMSLTQLYQNTQAPTSPALAEALEDVAFTRPSPNFTQARHTSPVLPLSSPIKAMQGETPRTDPALRSSSEPRAEYVSMKESQERRRRTTLEQPVQLVEQDSWETPTVAQIRLRKRKQKEDLERKAAMSFANVSAPAPLSPMSPHKRKGASKTSLATKFESSRRIQAALDGEDGPAEEIALIGGLTGQNEDLPLDQLSQDLVPSARTPMKHNGTGNSVQVPKTSSYPVRTQSSRTPKDSSQDATPSSQLQRETQFRAPATGLQHIDPTEPQSSRGSIAVMDSQPDATADYNSVPRSKLPRFPSSPSTNQYSINQTTMGGKTGYTSQVISSSMPPMPPHSSQDEAEVPPEEDVTPEAEKPIPSSPPLIEPEDVGEKEELVYDEHEQAYDEYNDETSIRDSVEPLAADDDVEMSEDDDLPLAKPEEEEAIGCQSNADQDDDDIDLVQPQKLEFDEDEEVPEALEQEGAQDDTLDADELPRSSPPSHLAHDDESMAAPQPPRTQRQNTVPETDALEETQPSYLPAAESPVQDNEAEPLAADEPDAPHQTNSTEHFHTAREQPPASQDDQVPPASLNQGGSDTIQANERLCSLQDIYNLPGTQQTGEEEIEMPRLSGLDENEEDTFMNPSSPAPPSAKRRKVTYTAKRKIFRSPLKSMASADVQMDQLPSSPLDQARAMRLDDAPVVSTQDREQQGASAAGQARKGAQALHTRQATLKSKPMPRPSRAQAQKKGALKPVSNVEKLLSSGFKSPSKVNGGTEDRKSTPVTPSKRRLNGRDVAADVEMPDVDEDRDELADTTPEPAGDEAAIEPVTDRGEEPVGDVIMPNRVFASWPGSHFYPATCLGRVAGRQLQIRFDDGNTTSLDATQVRALDLRPGDLVKVDVTGMKRHTYVVVGFKDKIDSIGGEELLIADRLGYATVVLEEKTRDSLPSAEAIQAAAKPIAVPIGSIYLTTQLWTRLRDRSFNFSPPASPTKSVSRMGTPGAALDPLATPSFTRRGTTAPSLLKDVTTRAASVASSSVRSGTGVFSNMAFVLTSTAADVDKEAIARNIKKNGGQVLDQGFHELFDCESADASPSSPGRRRSTSVTDGSVGLSLKPGYQDLGFVALISDSFSRSTKYIQALALNVPCLHLRWVDDSLSKSRAAPFARYLLPAGVSKFLDPNGVVRSRTMNVYDPAADDMSFAQAISDRDLLLHGQTVLLVTGKSKKEIEKRQPFVFLTHALGSANVGRCADLTAATSMLSDGQWDWIYVDNGEAGVADAAAELFGSGGKPAKAKKGKKRKREETEEKEELIARGMVGEKKVKITCSEFVIQSLILGALVEE